MTVVLADRLLARMAEYGSCLVAFSGGVDSAVVAAAARRTLGDRSLAVTAVSPTLSVEMQGTARRVASEIGIEHLSIETVEHLNPAYAINDHRRCFYCKQTLYQALEPIRRSRGLAVICSGTNQNDLGDYRPGIEAGRQAAVETPLADLGLGKSQVRQIARHFGLSVAELPAAPCLSSRIAYGEEVTVERLSMIERCEAYLKELGFAEVRVRYHAGDLARIEISPSHFARLMAFPGFKPIAQRLREEGFKYVTLDLEGYRSGSMNRVFQIDPPYRLAGS